jgi:hypothetical protein
MGEFKIDHATIAFRLALAEASEHEQARADALSALWPRSVFAATWPSPNEAPRTLTNSHGETALPLFTGLDTLETGADRFSWREPNGTIRFRELSAREALRYALTRQVNFVVLDVGFEHNVEFAREELEQLVFEKEADERRAKQSPPPSAAPARSPIGTGAAGTSARPSAAQVARPQASGVAPSRPRPQVSASAPQAEAWPHAAAVAQARAPAAQPQAPQQPRPASTTQPAASAAPQRQLESPPNAISSPRHRSSVPPDLPLPAANLGDGTASPRLQSGAVPIQRTPIHEEGQASPRLQSGAVPIQQEPPRPRANVPTPRQRTISASPPPPSAAGVPPPIAPPQDTSPKAALIPDARALLTSRQTEPPQAAANDQARKAAAEARRSPPPVPAAVKSKTPSTPGTPAPILEVPQPKLSDMRRRPRDDEPTLAERPNRGSTQRGLQASVPDSTLEALAAELQGFPEVEWACVLSSDDSEVPLVGVRIDSSFLNRVADITDVILDVGERQSVALQVLLLNNQDLIKNARRNGRAFYPWNAALK